MFVAVSPTQASIELPGKIHLGPVDPLVWLTFGCWLLWLGVSREWGAVRSPGIFHVLFVLAALVSALRVGNRGAAWKEVLQYAEYFLAAALVLASVLRDPAALRRVVYVFLGIGTAVALLGAWHYGSPGVPAFEVRATFGNRNVFGGFLALFVPLAYGMLAGGAATTWRDRIWLGLAILVAVPCVLAGGTAVALAIALGVVSALRGPPMLVGYLAALLLVGAVTARLPRGNLEAMRESIALYGEDGRGTRRYMEWEAGVAMTAANPWGGVGAGNYQFEIGQYYGTIPVPPVKAEADSQMLYLVLASSLGVPGAFCFLGMLLAAIASAGRQYIRTGDRFRRGLALGLIGSLTAFAVNGIWSPLLVRGIGVPLALVLALASASGEPEEGKPEANAECRMKNAE